MTTAAVNADDMDALRSQVRAAQHARSFPLLVIGGLLLNYGVTGFAPQPVAWRYGAPLAFVLIWGLSKLNERRIGVGIGRADYLVAAAFVFAVANAVFLRPLADKLTFYGFEGVWTLSVGLALLVIAHSARDTVLRVAGGLLSVIGVAVVVGRWNDGAVGFFRAGTLPLATQWPNQLIGVAGVVLVVAGLLFYRRERQQL